MWDKFNLPPHNYTEHYFNYNYCLKLKKSTSNDILELFFDGQSIKFLCIRTDFVAGVWQKIVDGQNI